MYLLADVLGPVLLAELRNVPQGLDAPREDAALAVVVARKILVE